MNKRVIEQQEMVRFQKPFSSEYESNVPGDCIFDVPDVRVPFKFIIDSNAEVFGFGMSRNIFVINFDANVGVVNSVRKQLICGLFCIDC